MLLISVLPHPDLYYSAPLRHLFLLSSPSLVLFLSYLCGYILYTIIDVSVDLVEMV